MSVAAVLSRVRHLLVPPAALCPHARQLVLFVACNGGRAKPRAVACARSTHCCLSARASLTLTYSLPFVTQTHHATLDWQLLLSSLSPLRLRHHRPRLAAHRGTTGAGCPSCQVESVWFNPSSDSDSDRSALFLQLWLRMRLRMRLRLRLLTGVLLLPTISSVVPNIAHPAGGISRLKTRSTLRPAQPQRRWWWRRVCGGCAAVRRRRRRVSGDDGRVWRPWPWLQVLESKQCNHVF